MLFSSKQIYSANRTQLELVTMSCVVMKAKILAAKEFFTKDKVKAYVTVDKVILMSLFVMLWGLFTAPFFLFYIFPSTDVSILYI